MILRRAVIPNLVCICHIVPVGWCYLKEYIVCNLYSNHSSFKAIDTHDNNKSRVHIQHKDTTEEHRTLGVMETITGDEKVNLQYLQQKSIQFSTLIFGGHLNQTQVRVVYSSIYMPSMLYILAACNHDNDQLLQIQRQAVYHSLAAMGYEIRKDFSTSYGVWPE